MERRNFDQIRSSGDLLFESIRGSKLHGLDTPKSDTDTFGLFICRPEELYGFTTSYYPSVSDEKNDNSWSELRKFINELSESNPNALESLFTPPEFILHYDSILDPLFSIKDSLITKKCYKAFSGYATSQIKKAKNLKKSINLDPKEMAVRKSPLHFCIVPQRDGDGAVTLDKFLNDNGLKIEHCGAVHMPRGENLYNLYYDWNADKDLTLENYARLKYGVTGLGIYRYWHEWRKGKKTTYIKYGGIFDLLSPTTQIRLSSISKEDAKTPIATFQFNQSAFSSHCKDYKQYHDWVKNRNEERFSLNSGYNFDAKNMCECVRLLTMSKEILLGEGVKLDRRSVGDREFLLSIKNHQMTYDEIIKYAEELCKELDDIYLRSTLPEEPNREELEKILVQVRKSHYTR